MKDQNKFSSMLKKFGAFMLAIIYLSIHAVTAQSPINLENYLYTFNPGYPYEYVTSGHYQEVTIPSTTEASYLYLEVKGGDGGYNLSHNGGIGAVTKGMFEIGTGTKQIPPGSTLRMIQGQHGRSHYGTTGSLGRGSAGGGGGGSAVVLLPAGKTSWDNESIVLMVAGGGGGGGQNQPGRPGCANETGYSGTSSNGADLNNGGGKNLPGQSTDDASGGASMNKNVLFGNASCNEGYDNPAGAKKGWPTGGLGCTCICWGGFGFGGGGSGNTAGGGGGGYSGGGGGGYDNGKAGGGGGGGSHVTSSINIERKSIVGAGTTGSPSNGYIVYGLLQSKSIKFSYNTGKCIDDTGSNTNNGTNILSYTCTGNANQQWYFTPSDREIHSALKYDKCLDLNQSNTGNGTNIQLFDCNGSSAQKWVYNGLYQTIHSGVNSDKCFDAVNGSATTANVNLQLWDCIYSNNNQKWVIADATTVSNVSNMKHIVPVSATSFAVHSHTGAESGSNIQLWTKDNTNTAEQWYFDGLAIKMRDHQNLCIDLNQSNSNNGNNIQLYTCNGTDAQKWIYDGMTKAIRSVINPDKCMQIEKNTDGVYGKRSNVDIQDCNGSAAQQFLIQE